MTYPDSKAYPMATSGHVWPECAVMKERFWKMVNHSQTEQSSDFSGESTTLEYKTPFMDKKKGEGIFVNSRSILRMRIERAEVAWTKLLFETKSQSNIIFLD